MSTPQAAAPKAVTNEVISLQISHLQETVDKLAGRIDGHDTRIRSVEDDRLKAWTVISVVVVFGVSGAAAFFKWLISN